jgi:hypothetical protein
VNASTTALGDALDEPVLTDIESGASQLLSTAAPDGLSNPFSSAQGGWIIGSQEVDPYTNVASASGTPNPFVGRDVDPYTNVPAESTNPNPFTGSQDVDPYGGVQNSMLAFGVDTSTLSTESQTEPVSNKIVYDNTGAPYVQYVYNDGTIVNVPYDGAPNVMFFAPVDVPASAVPAQPVAASPPAQPTSAVEAPVQILKETVISVERVVSDPEALKAAEGRGRFELGDAEAFLKGAVNGLVNLVGDNWAGPLVPRLNLPNFDIDPNYGGAGIAAEHLAANLALEALPAAPELESALRNALASRGLAAAARAPIFMGAEGVGEGYTGAVKVREELVGASSTAKSPEMEYRLPIINPHAATSVSPEAAIQGATEAVAARLRNNPELVPQYLNPGELTNWQSGVPWRRRLAFGNAVERALAGGAEPTGFLNHVGDVRPAALGSPDIIGVAGTPFEGKLIQITTVKGYYTHVDNAAAKTIWGLHTGP